MIDLIALRRARELAAQPNANVATVLALDERDDQRISKALIACLSGSHPRST